MYVFLGSGNANGDDRKKLIRELGRKPSEERVSLYVRKPSDQNEDTSHSSSQNQQTSEDQSRAKKFMDSMARRSMEVPADFLDTIKEEKLENKPTTGQQIAKKYPFNRTTTPNSLREHLKETLTKNLGGSASDIAETIEHLKNDEILDTFNIDNENVESPTVQRKAFRQSQRGLRGANSNSNLSEVSNESGGDFGNRRRNLKFRTLGSSGDKPLGDREIMLKKKRASTSDLSNNAENNGDISPTAEDDIGNGLFDRFSAARKTLTRGSTRRKRDEFPEDTKSLHEVPMDNQKKSSITSDWRSRLASKFKKSTSDQYEVAAENSGGEPSLNSYRKTSHELDAPMTEPVRRRTLGNGRKASANADYDSELVDGKYVTSVPIIDQNNSNNSNGNLRPTHREPPRGLKDLKTVKNPRDDLIQRLSSNTNTNNGRKAVSQGSVFDRLSNQNSGSRKDLSSTGTPSSRRSVASSDSRSGTTLTKIKDLTKNLRKNSKEEDNGNNNQKNVVAPRNSLNLFSSGPERSRVVSNLNNSRSSINSSTRSLQRDSPKSTRRATTSTFGKF